MKEDIKAQWTAALRSGEYKQGVGVLRDLDNSFCCLGVLCDLAEKAGVIEPAVLVPEEREYEEHYRYGGCTGTLPVAVMKWSGLETDEGLYRLTDADMEDAFGPDWETTVTVYRSRNLINDNDGKHHSFERIAETIEKYF
jgi:hypothetical protein